MKFTLALLAAAAVRAQSPPETGVVVAEVQDAITQALLPGVSVRLEGLSRNLILTRTESTGVDGAVRIGQLAPGEYQVDCSHSNYTPGPSQRITLAAGATQRLTFRLTPNASIEGRVLDEEGLPLAGASVYPRPVDFGPFDHSTTDRDGRFRSSGLKPGDYRLEVRLPLAIRKATLQHRADTGEIFGYPDTIYYPGIADRARAIVTHLSAGSVTPGLEVRLKRVLLADLRGRLIDRTSRTPLAGARVELIDETSPYNDPALAARAAGEDGSFHFELLTPGRYQLTLYRGGSNTLPWRMPLDVPKTGIPDLEIIPPAGQRIAARVPALEDGAAWTGAVRLRLAGAGTSLDLDVLPNADAITEEIPPGEWRIEARSQAALASGGKRLAIAGVYSGGRDVLDAPLIVSESGNPPLDVRLTANTGSIAGVCESGSGPRPRLITVRRPGVPVFGSFPQFAPVDANGGFRIADLAPGTYELSTSGLPRPVRVEVRAGETTSARLAVP